MNSGTAWLKTKLCSAVEDNEEAVDECSFDNKTLSLPDPDEKVFESIGWETYKHDPEGCNDYSNWFLDIFSTPKPSCMYSVGIYGLS